MENIIYYADAFNWTVNSYYGKRPTIYAKNGNWGLSIVLMEGGYEVALAFQDIFLWTGEAPEYIQKTVDILNNFLCKKFIDDGIWGNLTDEDVKNILYILR